MRVESGAERCDLRWSLRSPFYADDAFKMSQILDARLFAHRQVPDLSKNRKNVEAVLIFAKMKKNTSRTYVDFLVDGSGRQAVSLLRVPMGETS